jgi:ABC-2 type transport system permease protein
MSAAPLGRSNAAPLGRSVGAQVLVELRLTARRGENLLALAGIPVLVLLFFGSTSLVAVPGDPPVDYLLPGAIALAVVAAGLVNLGIATAYERSYGVLRRLGASPLGRPALIAAKIVSILAVVALQAMALVAVAWLALAWRPAEDASLALLVATLVLGAVAMTSLGLLLAGTLLAEATLALANGLFILAVAIGGVVVPTSALPGPLATIADLLPFAALSGALRIALGTAPAEIGPFLVLTAWGAFATIVASRRFRWD